TVRVLDAAQLAAGTGDADLVVVGDVEKLGPTELQRLLDFHRAGGGLLLVPGARADLAFWNDFLGQLGGGSLGADAPAGPGAARVGTRGRRRGGPGACCAGWRATPFSTASRRGRASP